MPHSTNWADAFPKKTPRQVSLDEPYEHDAKLVRREYGNRDGRLASLVDRIALTQAIKELPDGWLVNVETETS